LVGTVATAPVPVVLIVNIVVDSKQLRVVSYMMLTSLFIVNGSALPLCNCLHKGHLSLFMQRLSGEMVRTEHGVTTVVDGEVSFAPCDFSISFSLLKLV